MTKKDGKWKQIRVLTPASTWAGDPDSQEYALGTWLSWGTLGSRSGLMELISTVVNDLYDGSGVQRLQPHLHKADREEWHSQRGAAPRSRRGQQITPGSSLERLVGAQPALATPCRAGREAGMEHGSAVRASRSSAF